MYINSQNKQLKLQPLQGIITQGEKMADSVTFALPAVYGSLSLSDLSWNIRAASEKDTLATAALSVSTANDKCLLTWEVSSDFTAVSGALSLMLVGTDAAGNTVIKFPGDSPVWVRDSETGAYSPPEDAIENALNGLQQAESALEDATKALQEIGINFKTLGHFDTLPELEAAVTNPSPGDAYGVGDPTVVYAWNGTSWDPLPGVFQPYPHTNILVNSRFKYNGRNQASYAGGALTVDGWDSAAGSVTITLPGGVTVTSAGSISQLVQQDSTLFSKSATLSVADSTGTVYSVSATMPSSAQNTNSQIASQPTPWGSVALWNSNTGSAFSVVISATSAVILTAAKLEIGSVSTLAADLATAQDETIEQLRLDMYDLDPGRPAWVLTQNENLLDNWYFVGGGSQQGGGQFPINQRGQTSYTEAGYGIDRWELRNGAPSLAIESNGINFSGEILSSDATQLSQKVEGGFEKLGGKKCVFSALINGNVYCVYGNISGEKPSSYTTYSSVLISQSMYLQLCYSAASDAFEVKFITFESISTPITILAAKLELGTRSTLARLVDGEWVLNDPPPNFQQELAKCQRYLLVLPGFNTLFSNIGVGTFFSETEAEITIPTPTTMRIIPTCTATGTWLLRGGGQLINVEAGASNFFVQQISSNAVDMVINGLSRCPANQATQLLRSNNSTAKITLSAEL